MSCPEPQDTHLRRDHLLLGQACRREGRGFSLEMGAAHPAFTARRCLRPHSAPRAPTEGLEDPG